MANSQVAPVRISSHGICQAAAWFQTEGENLVQKVFTQLHVALIVPSAHRVCIANIRMFVVCCKWMDVSICFMNIFGSVHLYVHALHARDARMLGNDGQ